MRDETGLILGASRKFPVVEPLLIRDWIQEIDPTRAARIA
jgi:hypothetical protein